MQEEVKHYKVKSLPTILRPNSVYYVKATSQSAVKTYITDQIGFAFPLIDLNSTVQTVTGTGVTGTASNPIVDISTFKSSQLGNLIELSTNDGKLFVKPIISPDGSIDIVSTATSLELQLGSSLQTQIQNALQPGDNISELVNDVGYITLADIPFSAVSATAWTPNHTVATGNPYLAGTIVYYQGHIFQANFNNDSIVPAIGGNLYWTDLGVGYLIDQEQTDWLAVSGSAFIKNKPTNVSSFVNDAGYLTSFTETDPMFSSWLSTNPLSEYVPYTGATQDVDLGENSLSADSLQISTTSTEPIDVGKIVWNSADGTFDMGLLNGVTLQAGQEIHMYAKASGAISNGDAVQFAGAQGDHLLIKKAVPSEITENPEYFVGVATQDFANNDFGYVTVFGLVRDLDTEIYPEGTVLYFDSMALTDGLLTNIKPTGPNAKIIVAAVVKSHQNQGALFVRPHVMQKIGDLQNVEINNVQDSEVLTYDAGNEVWVNKALPSTPIPTLQSVTDEGNTTTNDIEVIDAGVYKSVLGNSQIYSENLETNERLTIVPNSIIMQDENGFGTNITDKPKTGNTTFYFEDEGGSKSIATREWTDDNKISKSIGSTYTTNAILTVTQAEYDAIVTKDPTTLYFIV